MPVGVPLNWTSPYSLYGEGAIGKFKCLVVGKWGPAKGGNSALFVGLHNPRSSVPVNLMTNRILGYILNLIAQSELIQKCVLYNNAQENL